MAVELVLRQRFHALLDALPRAAEGDVNSIHRARVASRRIRAVVPLLPGRAARRLERVMRRITRALGPVRELDVTLGIVGEMDAARALSRGAATSLRQAITEERQRLLTAMARDVDTRQVVKLQKKVLAAIADTRPDAGDLHDRLADARRRAARRAEALRAAIDAAAGLYLPDRLHEVRIAVKKLRYSMEIVRELRRSRAVARIVTLKNAQDLLGRMHDLEMLITRTRAVQGSAHAPNLRVSADLDALVRRLETECRQLHGQYMTSRSSVLSICDHVIADVDRQRSAA